MELNRNPEGIWNAMYVDNVLNSLAKWTKEAICHTMLIRSGNIVCNTIMIFSISSNIKYNVKEFCDIVIAGIWLLFCPRQMGQ